MSIAEEIQRIKDIRGRVRIPPSPGGERTFGTSGGGESNSYSPTTATAADISASLISLLSIESRDMSGTRRVPLSKGLFALVSAEDFERVSKFKWMARWEKHTFYALRDLPREPGRRYRSKEKLHRFILGASAGAIVDHADGQGLNNTRQNIRPATQKQNNRNIRKPRHGVTSEYKGVSWNARAEKFQANIRVDDKSHYLGIFLDPRAAALAYDKAAREFHGDFARTNFPAGTV